MENQIKSEIQDEIAIRDNLREGNKELKKKAYEMARSLENAEEKFNQEVSTKRIELKRQEGIIKAKEAKIKDLYEKASQNESDTKKSLEQAKANGEAIKRLQVEADIRIKEAIFREEEAKKSIEIRKELLERINAQKRGLPEMIKTHRKIKAESDEALSQVMKSTQRLREREDLIIQGFNQKEEELANREKEIDIKIDKVRDVTNLNNKERDSLEVIRNEMARKESDLEQRREQIVNKENALKAKEIDLEIREGKIKERERLGGLNLKGLKV